MNTTEKEKLLNLIQTTDDEAIINYLYNFTKDFIDSHLLEVEEQ